MQACIIDLPSCNKNSVTYWLKRCGVVSVIWDGNSNFSSDLVILPGVGNFGTASEYLNTSNFRNALDNHLARNGAILGICVGMHVLFNGSEESPEGKGLGLVDGYVERLESIKFRVPNIGWRSLHHENNDERWNERSAYFVHSFGVRGDAHSNFDEAVFLNTGEDFLAYFQSDMIFGAQFHPEKSGRCGVELIREIGEKIARSS